MHYQGIKISKRQSEIWKFNSLSPVQLKQRALSDKFEMSLLKHISNVTNKETN